MKLDTLYKRNSNPALFYDNQGGTNCGSFALNVTEWYTPYIEEFLDEDDEMWAHQVDERARWVYDLLVEGHPLDEVMEEITDLDFQFILKTCPWLEEICFDDMRETDRVIAYRLSMDVPMEVTEFDMDDNTDFHFRVYCDGDWWEKNGAGPVHKVIDMSEEPWEIEDWLVYNGPIRYARFRQEEI